MADTCQRRSQVSVDVVGEGFERRHIYDPASSFATGDRFVE
jgi:hypothetical protein